MIHHINFHIYIICNQINFRFNDLLLSLYSYFQFSKFLEFIHQSRFFIMNIIIIIIIIVVIIIIIIIKPFKIHMQIISGKSSQDE